MSNREGMITLGQVAGRFGPGVKFTADFIENTLNVKPDGTDKRASLYTEDTFVKICDSFEAYVARVRGGEYAEAVAPVKRPSKPKSPAAEAATAAATQASTPSFDEDDDDEI